MKDALFIMMKKSEHWHDAKNALRKMVDAEGHKRLCENRADRESEFHDLDAVVETFISRIEDDGLHE